MKYDLNPTASSFKPSAASEKVVCDIVKGCCIMSELYATKTELVTPINAIEKTN